MNRAIEILKTNRGEVSTLLKAASNNLLTVENSMKHAKHEVNELEKQLSEINVALRKLGEKS